MIQCQNYMKMKSLNKLKELENNNDLILDNEYNNFLEKLKEEIKDYEAFANKYKSQIHNYEDYKKAKQDFEKLNEINELFRYIGKENIESVISAVSSEINNNKKYKINEDLDKFDINNNELVNKINQLVSNYDGKSNYFIENNKLCLWFDRDIKNEKTRALMEKYNPIILSGENYTKIILKEV